MNSAIAATAHTWKRFRLGYVMQAVAAALVLAVSIAGGLFRGESWPSVSGTTVRSGVTFPKASSQAQVVYYIVGSQQQADEVEEMEQMAAWVRFDLNVHDPVRHVHIFVVGSTEEDRAINQVLREAVELELREPDGRDLLVIDLQRR